MLQPSCCTLSVCCNDLTSFSESKSGVTETHATPESLSQSASLSLPPSFSPFDCPTSPKEVTEEVKEIEPEKVASEKSPSPHVTPVESSSKSTSHKRTFGPTLPQDLKDRLMGGSGSKLKSSCQILLRMIYLHLHASC